MHITLEAITSWARKATGDVPEPMVVSTVPPISSKEPIILLLQLRLVIRLIVIISILCRLGTVDDPSDDPPPRPPQSKGRSDQNPDMGIWREVGQDRKGHQRIMVFRRRNVRLGEGRTGRYERRQRGVAERKVFPYDRSM
jgi:hypothetical protein